MTRVICDHCRTETEPDSYGLAPKPWLRLDRRGIYTDHGSDYCSLTCLVTAAHIEMARRSAEERAAAMTTTEAALAGTVPAVAKETVF